MFVIIKRCNFAARMETQYNGPEMSRSKLVVLLSTAILLVVLFTLRSRNRLHEEPVHEVPVQIEKRDFGHVELSDFDSLMQVCQDSTFDWTLLTAIAFVESKLDTTLVSEAGAFGLMQLMPSTYKHMLVKMDMDTNLVSNELNVRAAVRYLHELDDLFGFIGPEERLNYILASYNGGPGHVFDAMRLARRDGIDRFRWESLAPVLQSLSDSLVAQDTLCRAGIFHGTETFCYINRVQKKYHDFRLMELLYQASETLNEHIK